MENPEVYSDSVIQERESIEEGSADLEKLVQTAEAENFQMVKLIETERQRSTEFEKQIEETVSKTELLEESTKNLDVEAKQLHNKFKQNREICEGLKKTSSVLDEHEETLRKKFEMISLERQTQQLQHQQDVEKYEKIWQSYAKKYEENPMAKELSKIKDTAIKAEASVREIFDQITKIQSQIIEMEVEKTHMQEYLQGNPETAIESIVKIAEMYLDAERTATKAREKVQHLKNMKSRMERKTSKPTKLSENKSGEAIQTNENQQALLVTARANEARQDNEVFTSSKPNSNADQQTSNHFQDMVPAQVRPISGQSTRSDVSYPGDLTGQQNPTEEAHSTDQTTAILQEATPRTPSSNNQRNVQATGEHQHSTQESTALTGPPKTPTATGHVTPLNQSTTGTPVNVSSARSPLDFNKHLQYLRKSIQSPGEGFMYTGRSMYSDHTNQDNPLHGEGNHQHNEPDCRMYEAPLNDQQQHNIALNFFQPFEQEQQSPQHQNLFGQESSGQSPTRSRSLFNMRQSPSNSVTSSPGIGFSFAATSTRDDRDVQPPFSFRDTSSDGGGNGFLSSTSGGNMFGENNNQDNESFGGGFSFFGSSSSPVRGKDDNTSGFSFSFGDGEGGVKSPSDSNHGSAGFSLF